MRYLVFITLALLMACSKENEQPGDFRFMRVMTAETPSTTATGQPFSTRVHFSYFPGYEEIKFLGFDVKQVSNSNFEVRTKGFYYNIRQIHPAVFIRPDTLTKTLTIPGKVAGTYFFQFFSGNQLIESDTVLVH